MSEEHDPQSLEHNAKEYLDWLLATHHSEQTVTVRGRLLNYFFKWCHERGLSSIHDISRAVMEAYQRYLFKYRRQNGQPLVISSQIKRLSSVKQYFAYLSKRHRVLYNPAAELQLPKAPAQLPRQILNINDVQKVMEMPDLNTPEGQRDRAMLELLYSTGMRRMELANLSLYDIDFSRELVFVKEGKGRKDRVIPVGERALKWLRKYIDDGREKMLFHEDEIALFITINGEKISENYLTQLTGTYIKKAELGKQGSCHIFRHTMATLMLENGADIRYIQQMLGHTSLRTTQIYTQVSIKQLKSVHKLTHPASQKSGKRPK